MDIDKVNQAVRAMADAQGSAYIGNVELNHTARVLGRALATLCGVTAPVEAISDKDLISLYSVARKSPQAASQVAERINRRYGTASAPFDPFVGVPEPREPVTRNTPPATPAPAPDNRLQALQDGFDILRGDIARLSREIGSTAPAYEVQALHRAVDDLTSHTNRLAAAIPTADTMRAMVADALKALAPVTLQVSKPGTAPTPLGLVHRKTPAIIQALAAGVNVYLHGPAGSGKTTAAQKCADALGVPFYFAAKVADEYQLIGYTDAVGKTVRTQFREAYENGGVFLFDEMDASNSTAIVALNASLANGQCPFPDGIVKRHPEFYCIGAGNTKLQGANRQYSGRVQLDAASVDRFAFIEFGYDDALETALATNAGWAMHVQALRKAVADRGLPHLITPRATYDGCKLLAAGFDWEQVEDMTCFKGLDADTVDALRIAVNVFTTGNSQAA